MRFSHYPTAKTTYLVVVVVASTSTHRHTLILYSGTIQWSRARLHDLRSGRLPQENVRIGRRAGHRCAVRCCTVYDGV